ncbi:MAG: LrgB family protein [Colwellia sp.]|nr:LrgB family protein [Colwellia sp.]
MANYSLIEVAIAIGFTLTTVMIYQVFSWLQKHFKLVWLNPMLLSIMVLIPILISLNVPFEQYFSATKPLNQLLEPAVVALGFPLYQHLKTMKYQWQAILVLLILSSIIVIVVSATLTIAMLALPEIAVSLSLKSVTTPIGIALTEELGGNSSITAFAIILAGLFGALLGPRWLNYIKVSSPKAQGLAIGAASHALGTATISKISYEHAAYGSLSLILSAVITALVSPLIIPILLNLLN